MRRAVLLHAVAVAGLLLVGAADAPATSYYVRQTVGDDVRDGLTPATAWRSLARLSHVMHAGDTIYVGPGLYREQVTVLHDGAAGNRIVFVADTTGQHTGDPPGVVMIAGADPVDEGIFTPTAAPGVYAGEVPYPVLGVVEMDGAQRRYVRTRDTREHVVEKLPEAEVVARLPASHFYDQDAKILHLHTSDGKPPAAHEIELIRRGNGIGMTGMHFVTVMGFTFRHMGDAGISFFKGSGDGMALNNTSYGGRQGIRVYGASRVLVYGNTLFRNDNSGVYFALESSDGVALGNTAYENVKGLRWSSRSVDGLALDNVVFDNLEAGIALEDADRALLRRNVLASNARAQLEVSRSAYGSEANCFDVGGPGRLVADFVFGERYETLALYQGARRLDLHSRAGGCGPLPAKIDVRALHAETLAYAERARAILVGTVAGTVPTSSPRP